MMRSHQSENIFLPNRLLKIFSDRCICRDKPPACCQDFCSQKSIKNVLEPFNYQLLTVPFNFDRNACFDDAIHNFKQIFTQGRKGNRFHIDVPCTAFY